MQMPRLNAVTHTASGLAAHCAAVISMPRSMSASGMISARTAPALASDAVSAAAPTVAASRRAFIRALGMAMLQDPLDRRHWSHGAPGPPVMTVTLCRFGLHRSSGATSPLCADDAFKTLSLAHDLSGVVKPTAVGSGAALLRLASGDWYVDASSDPERDTQRKSFCQDQAPHARADFKSEEQSAFRE